MRSSHLWLMVALAAVVALAGCGGDGPPAPAPAPPGGGGAAGTLEVGPMLVRTAATAGLTVEEIPGGYGTCAFAAIHGAQINFLASRALLDRIAFTSDRDGYRDIWRCELDGGAMTQLTNNGADERAADWSPDGSKIAFQRAWPSQDWEIMTMSADGSSIKTRTNNTATDRYPSWSPDGRAIAYDTDQTGNSEVYRMYEDGTGKKNLTGNPSADSYPDWSPTVGNPRIVFATTRDGNWEIYKMGEDGSSQTRLTNNTTWDIEPQWDANGNSIAFRRLVATWDIFVMSSAGGAQRNFSGDPANDGRCAWSGDGNWIVFASDRDGDYEIWLQQTHEPFMAFQVTRNPAWDHYPTLGSPTVQVERVLIGAPGSDWGGLDPIWSTAYAGIVAFDPDGYRSFVRIGVAAIHLGSLQVTPMADTGMNLAGVVVEATEIVNLREDAGRGVEPITWLLDPLDAGAALLYFDADTGKLVSVLAVRESAYPAAASAGARSADATSAGAAGDAPAWTQSAHGDRLVVEGDFSAVFDADGRNATPDGARRVVLDASGTAVDVD